MRFAVCVRSADGMLSVLSDRAFDTREEAMRALSAVATDPELAGADLFLIDLDAVSPVVLVPAVAAPPAPEPDDAVMASGGSLGAETEADQAAEALEESPDVVWLGEPRDFDEPQDAGLVADLEYGVAEDAGPLDLAEFAVVELGELPDAFGQSVLWIDETPAPEGVGVLEVPEEVPTFSPLSEQPASEVEAVPDQTLEDLPEEPAAESADFAASTVLDEVPLPELADLTLDASEPSADMLDVGAADEAGVLRDTEESSYFRVDFEGWTCTDCVFVATCDRAGVDKPATCGSFQWKTS